MQFSVNENNLREAEERIRRQAVRQNEMQAQMKICLQELKKLAPLGAECVLLLSVIKRMQEETFQQEQIANALSDVMNIYRISEERTVENGWNSASRYRNREVTRIEIPVYNSGVIKKHS